MISCRDIKIGLIGCRTSSIDLINILEDRNINFSCIVTIDPGTAQINKVAGYRNLEDIANEKGITLISVPNYNLDVGEEIRNRILEEEIDVFIALDWQRLIPTWLLEAPSVGVFGAHSPSKLLPYGRGRSPINWSLLQNKQQIVVHLIKYDSGVDDGKIVAVDTVKVSPLDTCHTLYLKQTLCIANMITDCIIHNDFSGSKQCGVSSYYPKRTETDGKIDWYDTSEDIYNHVRSVTKPFPGAFSYLKSGQKITIWEAIPFSVPITPTGIVGRIVEMFHDGSFLVSSGGYSHLLVKEYEGEELTRKDIGSYFNCDIKRKVWENLPI